MPRRALSEEEAALWARVVATVEPLDRSPAERDRVHRPPRLALEPAPAPRRTAPGPGSTLDKSWDRKLARGALDPDRTIDLHGHSLDSAYELLDRALASAIASDARVVLLVTGHPPASGEAPIRRGKIRAAVGDWLAASRHAGHIAAVRPAHQRHGGRGALYIVLRRRA